MTVLLVTPARKTERGGMIWNLVEIPVSSRLKGCCKEAGDGKLGGKNVIMGEWNLGALIL